MKIDEALKMADEWTRGQTFHENSEGWRPAIAVMLAEIVRLKKENAWIRSATGDNATSFENGKKEAEAEWLSLEKQYSESLGRLAQLCNTVIPWLVSVMAGVFDDEWPQEVRDGYNEIMEYVESVKP